MADFQVLNGSNFATTDNIRGVDLSKILKKVAAFLQSESPYAMLERYDDWWEHDGLHFYCSSFTFDQLFETVHSPKTLLEAMPGDFQVFIGVYSKQVPFYLRFYVDWNDDETEIVGRFDITVPNEIAERFRHEVVAASGIELSERPSEGHYRSIIE